MSVSVMEITEFTTETFHCGLVLTFINRIKGV